MHIGNNKNILYNTDINNETKEDDFNNVFKSSQLNNIHNLKSIFNKFEKKNKKPKKSSLEVNHNYKSNNITGYKFKKKSNIESENKITDKKVLKKINNELSINTNKVTLKSMKFLKTNNYDFDNTDNKDNMENSINISNELKNIIKEKNCLNSNNNNNDCSINNNNSKNKIRKKSNNSKKNNNNNKLNLIKKKIKHLKKENYSNGIDNIYINTIVDDNINKNNINIVENISEDKGKNKRIN